MTTTVQTAPALDELAQEINNEHDSCEAALKVGVRHALNAGGLLREAKARVPHGQWGEWLRVNVTFPERTAQFYMRIARELPRLEDGNPQRVADLSLREVQKLLAAPSGNDHKRTRLAELEGEIEQGRDRITQALRVTSELEQEAKRNPAIAARFKDAITELKDGARNMGIDVEGDGVIDEGSTTTPDRSTALPADHRLSPRQAPDVRIERGLDSMEVIIEAMEAVWDDADHERWRSRLKVVRRSISKLVNRNGA